MQTVYAKHAETLGARESRKVANNTYLKRRGEDIAVMLHATDVLTFHADNTVTLNAGGWYTATTKDRLNTYLPAGFGIWQEKGVWSLSTPAGRVRFFDGMRVDLDTGRVVNAPEVAPEEYDAENKALEKAIARVLDGLTAESVYDMVYDRSGDCWTCRAPRGSDPEHLRMHVDDGTVNGTIIHRAYEHQRYGNPAFVLQMDVNERRVNLDSVKSNLRKYFRTNLRTGPVAFRGWAKQGETGTGFAVR